MRESTKSVEVIVCLGNEKQSDSVQERGHMTHFWSRALHQGTSFEETSESMTVSPGTISVIPLVPGWPPVLALQVPASDARITYSTGSTSVISLVPG